MALALGAFDDPGEEPLVAVVEVTPL